MTFRTCSSSAPGKVILFGEHAAVYGRPAIAIPVTEVNVRVVISSTTSKKIHILAPDIQMDAYLDELPENHPIAALLLLVQTTFSIPGFHSFGIQIDSTIPVAAGLGSSAAVIVALTRALSLYFDLHVDNRQISDIAFEIEKIQHGAPSGIDNTVITYQQPILYQREHPLVKINPGVKFFLLVGDTGIPSKTSETVGRVRTAWQNNPVDYNNYFDKIGELTIQVKNILECGETVEQLGKLMSENHSILQSLEVSCDALDNLVNCAIQNGAFGAKLCGSGTGGNMIALVPEFSADNIREALIDAGAARVFKTTIEPSGQTHE